MDMGGARSRVTEFWCNAGRVEKGQAGVVRNTLHITVEPLNTLRASYLMHPFAFQAFLVVILGMVTSSWCYLDAPQTKTSSFLTTATCLSTAAKLIDHNRKEFGKNSETILYFKRGEDKGSDDDDRNEQKKQGLWSLVQRLNPFTKTQVLLEAEPNVDTGMRYQVRLRNPDARQKRHVITRITRYLPDLSYQTAEDIFEDALSRGIALLRVLNSRSEAEELAGYFRRANPPVEVDIFDLKQEVILDFSEDD